jgi:F-type H+-transporting ATPase subunit b
VSPSLTTFLFETANFVILAGALGWVFFRPVQDAIEQRRAGLEKERREAEGMRADAARRLAEAEARRRELETAGESIEAAARAHAEHEAAAIVAAARTQTDELRARLEAELAALRRRHARTLARDAAAAARALVERLLSEIGGPDLDAALVRAACQRLRTLPATRNAGPVQVDAARPLTDAARASLAEAIGAPAPVAERIVPELGAGLRVITPVGLVDASAAGMAAWAERELAPMLVPEEHAGG